MNATETFRPFAVKGLDSVVVNLVGQPHDGRLYSLESKERISKVSSLAAGILDPQGLEKRIFVPMVNGADANIMADFQNFTVYRPTDGIIIYDRAIGDGISIGPGESALFAVADCPIAVMCLPKSQRIAVARAGLEVLVGDMSPNSVRGPRHVDGECLVSRMLAAINCKGRQDEILVAVILSIGEAFDFKSFDRKFIRDTSEEARFRMIEHVKQTYGIDVFHDSGTGRLSMFRLIQRQCLMRGIKSDNVLSDGHDTFKDEKDGKRLWWSHCRGDEKKNAVLVSYDPD